MSVIPKKRILYINATPDNEDIDNRNPKAAIKCISECYGYEFVEEYYTSEEALVAYFKAQEEKINIIYIAAHAKIEGVSFCVQNNQKNVEELDWWRIAEILCESDGLDTDTCVYLGCCDGGYKRIALILMSVCWFIGYVAGLPCELYINREGLAFHTFLHHHEQKSDANRIGNAVTTAIEQQFNVYLRPEMDVEIALFSQGFDHNFIPDDTTADEENTKSD